VQNVKLNDRQRRILIGVLRDQQRVATLPWGDDHSMSRDALGRHRLRIRQAREGMVPMALEEWLGRPPTNSDHVLCHRACVQLEGMGLLVRCSPFGRRRTTHLKLTPAGRHAAKRLLADEQAQEADDIDEMIDWSSVELMPIEVPGEAAPLDDRNDTPA
jgi:hypothetical protein